MKVEFFEVIVFGVGGLFEVIFVELLVGDFCFGLVVLGMVYVELLFWFCMVDLMCVVIVELVWFFELWEWVFDFGMFFVFCVFYCFFEVVNVDGRVSVDDVDVVVL